MRSSTRTAPWAEKPLWRQDRRLSTIASVISSLSRSIRSTSARNSRSTCRESNQASGRKVPSGSEATVRHQHVDMWVEVEQLARRLHESHGSRGDVGAVEVGREIELQGSPGTAGQLSQELAVVAKEDPQPLGDGEDHLAVGDVLEQLLLGPVRPQKLALLVAARAQAPELAGEGDQKLVPAVRAAHPGDALVEDAAVEGGALLLRLLA